MKNISIKELKRRKKISKSLMGRFLSKEHREQISISMKKKCGDNVFIEKISNSHIGKKHSEETKKKISESIKSNLPSTVFKKEQKPTIEIRKKLSESHKGEKSHFWKGGITSKNKEIRNSVEFRLWREAVFARDGWTCQKTGIKGGKLHAHHIKNFSQYHELRFAIDNGITLNKSSHKEFHQKYGNKNNNNKQLKEFLTEVSSRI